MEVVHSIQELGVLEQDSAVVIGNFDGVHLGHHHLIEKTKEFAQNQSLVSVAYTFDPHPAKIFRPDLAPLMIEPLSVKLERLHKAGIDIAFVQPFDSEFAKTSPESFIEQTLVQGLRAKHVIVGNGFVFGHNQSGSVETLEQEGQSQGFEVHPQSLVQIQGIDISSTRIREFVQRGNLTGATLLLGRYFQLRGYVIYGAQRGKKIGIPTANLKPANELLPKIGVYACIARGKFGTASAVVNIGVNPTFDESELKIEAHLLDTPDLDLYGSELRLEFVERIRGEKRFKGIESLKEQVGSVKEEIQENLAALQILMGGLQTIA